MLTTTDLHEDILSMRALCDVTIYIVTYEDNFITAHLYNYKMEMCYIWLYTWLYFAQKLF